MTRENLVSSLKEATKKTSTPEGAASLALLLASGNWLGLALQFGVPALIGVIETWSGSNVPSVEEVAQALSEMRKEDPLNVDELLNN